MGLLMALAVPVVVAGGKAQVVRLGGCVLLLRAHVMAQGPNDGPPQPSYTLGIPH